MSKRHSTIPPLSDSDRSRFYAKITTGNPDECWPWTAALNDAGYGAFGVGPGASITRLAHRVAYLLHHGTDPFDRGVCHTCDNPPCCNPAHLFLGTQADNMQDAKRKGRTKYRGGYNRKLTPEDVRVIRLRSAAGESLVSLAREFGITHCATWKVATRRTWVEVV